MMRRRSTNNIAFSLVELSIVLVILGLLTGGILAGQSLIRAAELRAVPTEFQRYLTATQSFRDKYFALPGDMATATSFWGIAGGNGSNAACKDAYTNGIATCNGDGDGVMNVTSTTNSSYEPLRYWQHLANAGLIEGSYRGTADGVMNYSPGVNAPNSKLAKGVWMFRYEAPVTGSLPVGMFNGEYGNSFTLGGITSNPASYPGYSDILPPSDAWNIDTKLDDGKPGTGKVVIRSTGGCDDTNNSSVLTAGYNLTSTVAACSLIFRPFL